MPLETGIWTSEEAATRHDFSYRLAKWIGEYLPKNERVADVGCGNAAYLRYLHDIGFESLVGFEGTEQNFEYGNVNVVDLTQPLHKPPQLIRPQGHNTICLEVAEHIPEDHLPVFLDNLCYICGTGKLIMSWAIPGQDGIGHVSCKHNIWVVAEMKRRGYRLLLEDSLNARSIIENRLSYFRNTLMLFERV